VFELGFKDGLIGGCARCLKKCNNATHGLIEKLERRFLSHEIMNAINIIYPEFWI
jgi:hypothetical protein